MTGAPSDLESMIAPMLAVTGGWALSGGVSRSWVPTDQRWSVAVDSCTAIAPCAKASKDPLRTRTFRLRPNAAAGSPTTDMVSSG